MPEFWRGTWSSRMGKVETRKGLVEGLLPLGALARMVVAKESGASGLKSRSWFGVADDVQDHPGGRPAGSGGRARMREILRAVEAVGRRDARTEGFLAVEEDQSRFSRLRMRGRWRERGPFPAGCRSRSRRRWRRRTVRGGSSNRCGRRRPRAARRGRWGADSWRARRLENSTGPSGVAALKVLPRGRPNRNFGQGLARGIRGFAASPSLAGGRGTEFENPFSTWAKARSPENDPRRGRSGMFSWRKTSGRDRLRLLDESRQRVRPIGARRPEGREAENGGDLVHGAKPASRSHRCQEVRAAAGDRRRRSIPARSCPCGCRGGPGRGWRNGRGACSGWRFTWASASAAREVLSGRTLCFRRHRRESRAPARASRRRGR